MYITAGGTVVMPPHFNFTTQEQQIKNTGLMMNLGHVGHGTPPQAT